MQSEEKIIAPSLANNCIPQTKKKKKQKPLPIPTPHFIREIPAGDVGSGEADRGVTLWFAL